MALLFPENKKIPLYTGFCVETGIIDYDENGDRIETESERHKVAARLYRKSKTPEALYNLALLISECKTSEDENGNPIRTQKQRDRIAVRLWQTSKVPEALYNISKWINECKTNEDENGIPITTQDQRNRIVARLLQTSKTPEALGILGIIILKQKVNYDEYNKKINTQEERYAASARLFRQSKTAGALNSLANMIYNKQISTDENNQTVPESERNAVAARLFRTSGIQESLYNIAIMISRNQIEHDELGNKLTTNQSRIDTVYRLTETASLSQKHSIRGYALLKLDGDSLANKKRALAEYDLALQNGFNEILATYAILLEEIESIENRMHLTHTGDIKDSSNSADVQTTAEQIAIEPPLVAEAPSPFEESEVAKQIAIEAPSAAEASIPLDENEDDDDSSDSEESAHDEKMDHVASSEYSSAEYSMIKQQTAKQWKQHIEEKRRRKASEDWERKKAAARDRKLSLEFLNASTQDSIREKWLPQAVQGRVNLAQFHDERIIMLINDIKDGGNRGKPEILGSDSKYKGYMSRRITKGHRLVYKFDQTTKMLEVIECGGHYEKAKSSK